MTFDELLAASSRDGRVCPQPKHWSRIWEMLPGRVQTGTGWQPPLPLILAAWEEATDVKKRERFHVHLRWASEHGALTNVANYIDSLMPEDWHTET